MNGTTLTAFVVGVLIGVALTLRYVNKQKEGVEDYNLVEANEPPEDISRFNNIVDKSQYKTVDEQERPDHYIIPPDVVGLELDYDIVSLTYYADGVLADDRGEKVDDISDKVGSDFHRHFGEYEEDSVFVRNHKLKCDYEILKDLRTYAEVLALRPRRGHDET